MKNNSKNKKQRNQMRRRDNPRVLETPGRALSGFPNSLRVTLKYVDAIELSAGAGYSQYTFRGNSVFDPDYTSTGHQPLYFDTYAGIYGKYKVLGSSIHVRLTNRLATDTVCFCVLPHSEVITHTSTTMSPFAEMPFAKLSQWFPISTRAGVPMSIMHQISTTKILGLKSSQIEDEDYSALVGANPLSIWYWNIAFSSGGTSNVNVHFSVELKFDVVFYDRATQNPSLFVKDPEKDHVKQPRYTRPLDVYNAVAPVPVVSSPHLDFHKGVWQK